MTDLADELQIYGPDPELEALFAELIMSETGRTNPYHYYARFHSKAPIYNSSFGPVIFSRYDDCQRILRDNRFGKEEDTKSRRQERAAALGLSEKELQEATRFFEGRTSLLFLNPPDHTRLRSLVSRAFTPRRVEQLKPHVEILTEEILSSLVGEVDVMESLAWKLPATVICELLGVPVELRETFRPLIRTAISLIEPNQTKEDFFKSIEAAETLTLLLTDLIEMRRRDPADDLLSHLISVQDGTDRLSLEELISTSVLLFMAGFETTTNLIGNGLYALLQHPLEFESLFNDLTNIDLAVEELLRFDSPVQFDMRTALSNFNFGGIEFKRGQPAMTLLGAANHDPTHFTNPEELNLKRDEGPPLSFASGIHYCLGASLARMEGRVVFSKLIETFSSITLVDKMPERRNSITLRGLKSLNVKLERR